MDEGFGAVSLPNALDSKYPSDSKELKWQWHFPQKNRWKNELTGQEGRWHVDESPMQRAVKNAILEAGINDLYPCSEPRGWRRGKPAEQNVKLTSIRVRKNLDTFVKVLYSKE